MSIVRVTEEDLRDAETTAPASTSATQSLAHRTRQLLANDPFAPADLTLPPSVAELEAATSPVELQRDLAIKIKRFVDQRMAADMKEKGFLTAFTRGWIELYNEILDRVHRNTYGDKNVSLSIHKIDHGQIATMIRSVMKDANRPEPIDVEVLEDVDETKTP